MANAQNLKPFQKGDSRINRKGRPKSFAALRALAQSISHEIAHKDDKPVVVDGKEVTVAETILREWATSPDPRLQMRFVEVAFGKVPDEVLVGGKADGDAIPVRFVDYRQGLDGSSEAES